MKVKKEAMRSLKINQLIYKYSDDGEVIDTYAKSAFVDLDKITSFYIEEPEEVYGEMLKPFFLGCDGIAYSVLPEPHVYEAMHERFIKNAITE